MTTHENTTSSVEMLNTSTVSLVMFGGHSLAV